MDHHKVAETVYYRRPCSDRDVCDCVGARQSHRFDIDGQPFPWHITRPGARFASHHGIYVVRVTVIPILISGGEPLPIHLNPDGPPSIGDTQFPWWIEPGISARQGSVVTIPLLEMGILARRVDTDAPIADPSPMGMCSE